MNHVSRCACFCSRSSKHKRYVNFRSIASTGSDSDTTVTWQSSSFFDRINQPRHILAPMVAQSDLPFRLMCEQLYNVDLSYTQMIHAHNFAEKRGDAFRANHLDVYDKSIVREILIGNADSNDLVFTQAQRNALDGLDKNEIEASKQRIRHLLQTKNNSDTIEVKPTVVQIAAHDPETAARAAGLILEQSNGQCLAIDLNLGCPQAIARKGKYGSFLHDETPQDAYDVLAKLRRTLPKEVGVTAKIRLPPSTADAQEGKLGHEFRFVTPVTIEERVRRLIDCGVDLITVHGRTRFENKVAVGPANWGVNGIRTAVEAARNYSGDDKFPVFANGGIEFYSDVTKCFEETSCSGVMSSESLLENPGIFDEQNNFVDGKEVFDRQLNYAGIYLDYCTIFPPLPGSLGIKGGSFNVARSHVFKMLHRYLEEQPDLRSWLGNQELCTIKEARELLRELRKRYSALDEEQLRTKSSWQQSSTWYRRHRQSNASAEKSSEPLSLEEKKKLARLRIQALREQRLSRA